MNAPQAPQIPISPEDQASMAKMGEQLNFLLKKYEGFCINFITTLHHKGGRIESLNRIEIGKLVNLPPQKSPLAI